MSVAGMNMAPAPFELASDAALTESGAYLNDGRRLVRVIGGDGAHVWIEDAVSLEWIRVHVRTLQQDGFVKTRPASDDEVRAWRSQNAESSA